MVIAKTRAENKWKKKRVLYCQIEEGQKHKCMTSMHVTVYYSQWYTGDQYLFLDIQFIALLCDKERRWSLLKSPSTRTHTRLSDCTEVTRCDTRCKDVNSARSQWISEQATVCFFFPSPDHYFIIWLMLPWCCQNAYTFPQRWKTNRSNLFPQIRYWSQLVGWASDIFAEKWMSDRRQRYFFFSLSFT